MAEAKPDKKPSAPAPKKEDSFTEAVWYLLEILIVLFLFNGIFNAFASNSLFSRGFYGLTPAGIMEATTRPIASLANPIGQKVVSIKDTTVYDSPGGKEIGSHSLGDRGKILQGPVTIDGQRYWYVDYDKGVDGWVKEEDIAYIEREPNFLERTILWMWSAFSIMKVLSVLLSILLIIFIAYLIVKLTKVRQESLAKLYTVNQNVDGPGKIVNIRWEKILNHIESVNENDWKLSIIEADIMLDDLLDKLGLEGESIGDKLKTVERSDFTTLDNAWEAHKIRNQIAHQGSDFILTQREVRRAVELYKSVFDEFGII